MSTPSAWCVGIVASGLRFPRGLAVLPGGDLIVAEMGGWNRGRGRLTHLRSAAGFKPEVLFDKLNLPHGVALGPARPQGAPVDVRIAADGSVFVTEDRNGTLLRLMRQ